MHLLPNLINNAIHYISKVLCNKTLLLSLYRETNGSSPQANQYDGQCGAP